MFFSYWISMASSFKKTKVKLDLLTDIDMLIMGGKCIGGGIYHSIYRYANTNIKYMKVLIKIKNLHIFSIFYDWAMSPNLPVNNFEWIKDTSQFNEDFIKYYNEESNEGYFLKVGVQ